MFKRLLGALFFVAFVQNAFAAGTQTQQLTTSHFVDLGALSSTTNIQVQALGVVNIAAIVADSIPADNANGNVLVPFFSQIFYPADAGSHLWVKGFSLGASVAYTPISVSSGGGGSTNATITNPLNITTTPASSVAVIPTGGFQPLASGSRMTQLTVTTSDSVATIPTGSNTIELTNTGSLYNAFCNVVGATATFADEQISPLSTKGFSIPTGVTTVHCITLVGSTTINGTGGYGAPYSTGGGGSIIPTGLQGTPTSAGATVVPTQDSGVANLLAANVCNQPCPTAALGDQLTYEAMGGTVGNAALTNTSGALSIATTALNLMRIECWNPNTVTVYLQFFDSATSITLGTTVPKKIIEIPPGNGIVDGSYDHEYGGIQFTTGFRVAATTTQTGSSAPANAVKASIGYKLGN